MRQVLETSLGVFPAEDFPQADGWAFKTEDAIGFLHAKDRLVVNSGNDTEGNGAKADNNCEWLFTILLGQ